MKCEIKVRGGGLEGWMDGDRKIYVYNGRVQMTTALPIDIKKARAMVELYAQVLDMYQASVKATQIDEIEAYGSLEVDQ
jgi:hypothetical protein